MKSWDEIAPEPLEFTIRGKKYTIPDLPYQSMLTLQKVKAGQATELDDADATDSWRLVMGPVWDEMVGDNVPAEAIMRAGLATYAYFESGRALAESIWESGLDPKALAAAIQSKTEPQPPNSTDAANATRSRASMSGTSSRPTSSKKPRAKASRS